MFRQGLHDAQTIGARWHRDPAVKKRNSRSQTQRLAQNARIHFLDGRPLRRHLKKLIRKPQDCVCADQTYKDCFSSSMGEGARPLANWWSASKAEIYVRDFSAGGNRFQVSTDGGFEPVWAKNGKELFYRVGRKLVSVAVKLGADFVPGALRFYFRGTLPRAIRFRLATFHLTDSDSTLSNKTPRHQDLAKINPILDWSEELKRLVPSGNTK